MEKVLKNPLIFYNNAQNNDTATDETEIAEPLPVHEVIVNTNSVSEVVENIDNARYLDRLEQKFTDKLFHVQNKDFKTFLTVFGWFIQCVTVLVSYLAIYTLLLPLMSETLAMISSTVTLIFIELAKRFSVHSAAFTFFRYKKLAIPQIIIAVFALGASLYLTVSGSNESVFTLTVPPTLLSADTLNAGNKEDLADMKKQLSDVKRHYSWHGKLTDEGRVQYAKISSQIAVIQNNIAGVANQTYKENGGVKTQFLERTNKRANVLKYATVFLDCILIFLLGYLEYFDFISYVHVLEIKRQQESARKAENDKKRDNDIRTAKKSTSNNVQSIGAQPFALNENRSRIGFVNYDFRSENNENRQDGTVKPDNENRYVTKIVEANAICLNCKGGYRPKHNKQLYCSNNCRVKSWVKNKEARNV